MFVSVIDLICLGCFLSVSPIVKELALCLSKGEKRGEQLAYVNMMLT